MILPWALPTVVNGVLWAWIFDSNYGALNGLLKQLHIIDTYKSWLGTSFPAMTVSSLQMLKPAILVALVICTMEAFKVFDIIYIMTKDGPANGTQVISYYAYVTSFQYVKFGYGAALSYLVSIVILLLALIYIKFLYTEDY